MSQPSDAEPTGPEERAEWPTGANELPPAKPIYVCPECSTHSSSGSCPRGHRKEVTR